MDDGRPHRHRFVASALMVAATILTVLAIFAVWADRQALNADNWADTSSAMLENSAIRTQVSAFLVDQVYANVDVTRQVRRALPKRLGPIAGPAAGGLRQLAESRTSRLLERPRVQQAWETANRVTAQQFINLAEDKPGAVTASGDAVILDLRAMVLDLAQRLGLPGRLAGKVPPGAARIKVLESSQITTVQNGASALRGLAFVLPPLSFALFGLAVFLAGGRRRRMLMWVGIDVAAAGFLVLIARSLLGDYVVGSLATTAAVEPAASAAWSIGTGMLRDIAQATIIGAIPLLVAAWLAGPTRVAVAVRRALAPTLRDRPEASYAALAVLLLIVVAWGPIPATQKVVPVVVMSALAASGLHVLRRQTAAEFPYAHSGDTLARARGHARAAWRDVGTRRAPPPVVPDGARIQSLERLATLRDRGVLSDAEFSAEKAAVLAGADGDRS
jgi:hypothetical protein